ncbi:dihydrodipicolinate synthase family protein [Rhodobacterales bacterium HKCCE2091]|nr:dihydrodipicolinate synthase family protein [Rhodobacterales bacterium HKCCE2091]
MAEKPRISGIVTPLLTPFEASGAIAEDLFHDHARRMLADGAHYLAPFGTTGEAASVPAAARMVALERMVESGAAPADRLMPGTGQPSLADTIFLTRHALDLGVAAVMVLPPYFYADAGDEGLYRYFAALIEDIGRSDLRLILYHIPQMTRVGVSPALTRRLALDYPGIVAGYKDSAGQWSHTVSILRAAPGIAVFPASEALLPQALAAGGAGCISASTNVNVAEIRRIYDALGAHDRAKTTDALLDAVWVRDTLQAAGLIPAMKSVMAARTGDARWLNLLPPFEQAPAELGPDLRKIADRVPA